MADSEFAAKEVTACQSMLNRIPQSSPEDSDSLAVLYGAMNAPLGRRRCARWNYDFSA
jgi:hypothetical protein